MPSNMVPAGAQSIDSRVCSLQETHPLGPLLGRMFSSCLERLFGLSLGAAILDP